MHAVCQSERVRQATALIALILLSGNGLIANQVTRGASVGLVVSRQIAIRSDCADYLFGYWNESSSGINLLAKYDMNSAR
jgi:hypothetical protein